MHVPYMIAMIAAVQLRIPPGTVGEVNLQRWGWGVGGNGTWLRPSARAGSACSTYGAVGLMSHVLPAIHSGLAD